MFSTELPRYTGNVAWRGLVPAERVAHLDVAKVAGVWMGPNRSIVQYYIAAGKTSIDRHQPIGTAGNGNPAEGRIEDALAEYAGWHDTILHHHRATPRVLRQALYDREPLPDWRIGRVVLLGDAAPSDDAILRAGRSAEHRGRVCQLAVSPHLRISRSQPSNVT
jgi:salicylate hydroxylase